MSCNHRQHQSESNEIIYLKNSLLKYEPPHLIIQHDIPKKDSRKICRTTIPTIYSDNLSLLDPYSDSCRSEDILDLIFPPVEVFNKTNHKYITCVSRHPATRQDVYNLEQTLNHRLKQSHALEIGLCNFRREIYDQCFDELIRQITIECNERGLLLNRIHQTYKNLFKTYLNNYQSANAYAMRTLLIDEEYKMKLINQINNLQYDINELKTQLIHLEDNYENIFKYQSVNINIPFELEQLRINHKLLKQDLENVLNKKLVIKQSK